jgi:ribose transport system substrate-binding protein
MKKALMYFAVAALALSVGAANAADKKTLAVVVKGLDNPFFTVLGNGCALWNKENPTSEYECLYTGPALSSDEAGEVQLVADLIAKGVAGIAISPSNAPAMAAMLKEKAPKMPIMTIDADLAPG